MSRPTSAASHRPAASRWVGSDGDGRRRARALARRPPRARRAGARRIALHRLDDGWWNVGATKGGTSELIDFQRGPVVLSLKTLDPRLKYAGNDLPDHIRKLGARDIRVDGTPATKVLDIRVPPGHGQDAKVQKLVAVGRTNNVQVRITEYPR